MKIHSSLSLCNGMSVARMSLDAVGVRAKKSYYCEINKYANQATYAIYPDMIALGDIYGWRKWPIKWKKVEKIFCGFPCQPWSLAGMQLGDRDPRGDVFWAMLDIMEHARKENPNVGFLIENVKMKKEFEEYITFHATEALGPLYKTLINSALVSAQNRQRYYWTNYPVTQPEDLGILLRDIIETSVVNNRLALSERLVRGFHKKVERRKEEGSGFDSLNVLNGREKCPTLTARYYKCSSSDPYVQIEKERPCKMREGKQPMSLQEWGEEHHPKEFLPPPGVPLEYVRIDLEELADRYIMGGGRGLYKKIEGHLFEYDLYLSRSLKTKEAEEQLKTKGYLTRKQWYNANSLFSVLPEYIDLKKEDKAYLKYKKEGQKELRRREASLCRHVATATDIKGNESLLRVYAGEGKCPTLTTMDGGHRQPKILLDTGEIPRYRKLTVSECFRLQTIPEEIIEILLHSGLSNRQLYIMAGNSFTKRVIDHVVGCWVAHRKKQKRK